MTHDKLLAEIDQWLTHSEIAKGQPNKAINVLKALRAVVELHKPLSSWVYEEFVENHHCSCDEWNEYDMGWPCDTIQAIEKELG